jgi:hypothetical protein
MTDEIIRQATKKILDGLDALETLHTKHTDKVASAMSEVNEYVDSLNEQIGDLAPIEGDDNIEHRLSFNQLVGG